LIKHFIHEREGQRKYATKVIGESLAAAAQRKRERERSAGSRKNS
jgi:hypothetical protein